MISTKYHPPVVNKNIINRNGLIGKFQKVIEAKLTCVVAPAGYGKTTAVLDWLKNCVFPYAWLSLDARDNDPMVFWRYFCAALNNIKEGISKEEESALSSQELIHSNIHIDVLIDCLSGIESHTILVLDDLHMIKNTVIFDSLSYLVNYLPEKMHLIIISRTAPEFGLSRHKIKWQIQWLSESDLRFNKEEISLFYKAKGYDLVDDDVGKIEQATEGWAAALVAVAMSMDNTSGSSSAIAALTRSNKDVEQYLKNEVISTWSQEKKSFAVKTCILDMLSEDICDAITEESNGAKMLGEISAGSGFLIALDDQKQEYRYHHLFQSFLQKLLLESDSSEVLKLHSKAAAWYQNHGITEKAIEHFLRGGFYQEALDLIEPICGYLLSQNDYITLLDWIERLPEVYRSKSFRVAFFYAMYHAEMNQFELAWKWITKMEKLADQDRVVSNQVLRAGPVCALVKANVLTREGRTDALLHLIRAAAVQNVKSNLKMPRFKDFNTSDVYFYRCPVNQFARFYGENSEKYNDFITDYRGLIPNNPGYAHLIAGEYLYENNQLKDAQPFLLAAMEEAREAKCPGALVPAMVDIARIKRAGNDMPGAFLALDQCAKVLHDIGKPHWHYTLEAFRCRMNMDNNCPSKADEWFRCCKFDVFFPISATREFELIVYARMLIAKGRIDDAKLLLQRLLKFAKDAKRRHSEVELLNLFGVLAYKAEEMSDAFGYLERSLTIGLDNGFVRSFIDESEPFSGLLRQYIRYRGSKKDDQEYKELTVFAKTLLHQFRDNGMPVLTELDARADMLITHLTDQERKVLRLVMDAVANKDIGIKLGISVPTVKYYTGSIYGKLGVKNRAQCIKLAHEAHFFE